jgi:twitching motility two-component system response regulator PilH
MPIQRILVVDDSRTVALFLTEALEEFGFDTVSAANAEEAWKHIQAKRPDLVLLDVVMPGVNGFEFTRQLRRTPQYADLPVILCSTKSMDSDMMWGLRQGAMAYITKPVDTRQLLSKIQALN